MKPDIRNTGNTISYDNKLELVGWASIKARTSLALVARCEIA